MGASLAESVVRLVNRLRLLKLRKSPSVAESVDWGRTLVALGAREMTPDVVADNLGVLLKHQDDLVRARHALEL